MGALYAVLWRLPLLGVWPLQLFHHVDRLEG